MPSIDQDLRTLAVVSEAVGDDGLEAVGAEVESTDDACGNVAIEGALFDGGIPDGIRVTACDCSIADSGAIRLELSVETTADETPDEAASNPSGDEAENDDAETAAATESGETPARRDGGEVVTVESDTTAPASTTTVEDTVAPGDDQKGGADDADDIDVPAEPGDETQMSDKRNEDGTLDSGDESEVPKTDADHNDGSETPETGADADESSTDSSPPYRDPECLAAVYDSEDTFAEMTDALGVDVTPQTVRRYMIDHDIHEPRSQPAIGPEDAERLETDPTPDGDDDADDPVTAEDASDDTATDDGDAGLTDETGPSGPPTDRDDADTADARDESEETDETTPPETEDSPDESHPESTVDEAIPLTDVCDVNGAEDHTLGELIDAAVGARTMYEVQSTLGVDPDTTRALLEACNLTDLVTGRIDRSEGPDELDVRDRVAGALADGHR